MSARFWRWLTVLVVMAVGLWALLTGALTSLLLLWRYLR